MADLQDPISFQYKNHGPSTLMSFDIYLPSRLPDEGHERESAIPGVIYFHGGGLSVGNRKSWTPIWLKKRVLELGYAFISPDYRLLPPATAFDIVQDIQDLLEYVGNTTFSTEGREIKIDMNRICVSGSSAGGTCAYLATIHCKPKPKALISMYGMGGNFLIPHYLQEKHQVFFRGRDLLYPSEFLEYIYPFSQGPLPSIADSPLAYHPQTYHIPGYPANKRMLLPRLYLQMGNFLDYYTGIHEPSLSKDLLAVLESERPDYTEVLSDEKLRSIFPQLSVDITWPATMLLHGTLDSAVPIEESFTMKALIAEANVHVELIEFPESEHSFDYEPEAEDKWSKEFDQVTRFLRTQL